MKQIRYNVFETNSSSSHTLNISPEMIDSMMDTSLIPNEEGSIVLGGGEFGWEWEKYNDAINKANYTAVLLLELQNAPKVYNKEYPLVKFSQESYETCFANFEAVLKSQTGAKNIIIATTVNRDNDTPCDNYGEPYRESYIDHQSCEDIKDYLWLLEKEKIRQFIFNKHSWLYTGNDNDSEPPNFFDLPDTQYRYILKLEGGQEHKFIEYPKEDELFEALKNMLQTWCCYTDWKYTYDRERKNKFLNNKDTTISEEFSSYDQLDKNIVVLYQDKTVYNTGKEFLGYRITEKKKLRFSIEAIS